MTEEPISTIISSSTTGPYDTLATHVNTKWALLGFLLVLPILSALFLLVYIRMDRKKTNILNIQLAIVNMISAFLLLPMFYAFYLLLEKHRSPYVNHNSKKAADRTFCATLAVTYYITTSLHFNTLLALAFDRFLAVFFPFTYRRIPKQYYVIAIAVLWALTIALPLIGLIAKPHEDGSPAFFEYRPYRMQVHVSAFPEITFQEGATSLNPGVIIIPTLGQKVYCFVLMVIPFVVSPIITFLIGSLTMFKITKLVIKQHSSKSKTNNDGWMSATLCPLDCAVLKGVLMRRSNKRTGESHEMVYENKNQLNPDSGRFQKETPPVLKKTQSRKHINAHVEAFITLVLLMVLFIVCDGLWWFMKLSEALRYSFGIQVWNVLEVFPTTYQSIVGPIIGRFGLFAYAILVPFLMQWRQKKFRIELLSIFRAAKSTVSQATSTMFEN